MIGFYAAGAMGSGGALSGFPVVLSITPTAVNTSGLTHVIDIPAVSVGDRLVLVCGFPNNNVNPSTPPAGWTLVYSTNRVGVYYRDAASSSGASTVTITTGASSPFNARSTSLCYRIQSGTFHAGTPPEAARGANFDPPDLVPSWGLADTLWIAALCISGNDASDVLSFPLPDGNIAVGNGGTSSAHGVTAGCQLEDAVASKNPAAFTCTNSGFGSSMTIAVRPA